MNHNPAELDLVELEKIARAATPGPWDGEHDLPVNRKPRVHNFEQFLIGEIGNAQPSRQDQWEADAAHIAAFDPPTALALIEAARERNGWRDDCEGERTLTKVSQEMYKRQKTENAILSDELDTLRAHLQQAVEALEPFARIRFSLDGYSMDDAEIYFGPWLLGTVRPKAHGEINEAVTCAQKVLTSLRSAILTDQPPAPASTEEGT